MTRSKALYAAQIDPNMPQVIREKSPRSGPPVRFQLFDQTTIGDAHEP